MFDVAPTELMLLALVALVVIGPKDLPKLLRVVGNWVGRARTMARHFRSGIDEMVRQSELDELQKKWAEENARIMQEHPQLAVDGEAVPADVPGHDREAPPARPDPADIPELPLPPPEPRH